MKIDERFRRELGFETVWKIASEAGNLAVEEMKPITPMVVTGGGERYVVEDGVCGFASVNIKPGNSTFARWLKKNEYARKDSYNGGVTYYVHEFGQSLAKKETYAYAFAQVLRDNGFRASAMSRMD